MGRFHDLGEDIRTFNNLASVEGFELGGNTLGECLSWYYCGLHSSDLFLQDDWGYIHLDSSWASGRGLWAQVGPHIKLVLSPRWTSILGRTGLLIRNPEQKHLLKNISVVKIGIFFHTHSRIWDIASSQ